jgi:hypothetical protein
MAMVPAPHPSTTIRAATIMAMPTVRTPIHILTMDMADMEDMVENRRMLLNAI